MNLKEFEKKYKSVFKHNNIEIRNGDIIKIKGIFRDTLEIIYNIKINKEYEEITYSFIWEPIEEDINADEETNRKTFLSFSKFKYLIDNDRLEIINR